MEAKIIASPIIKKKRAVPLIYGRLDENLYSYITNT
jgi:hypothetical protein